MKRPKILRYESTSEGTFGVLILEGKFFSYTLEPQDPIPYGQYAISIYNSPKFGKVYKLENVPEHDYIEIHAGNTIKDTSLCILLGASIGKINGIKAVLSSRQTVSAFTCKLEYNDDILNIVNCI
jgi:hypothetical protein